MPGERAASKQPCGGCAKSGRRPRGPLATQQRAAAPQAFSTSLNWLSNLVVGSTFPAMLAALGISGRHRRTACLLPVHVLACTQQLGLAGSLWALSPRSTQLTLLQFPSMAGRSGA